MGINGTYECECGERYARQVSLEIHIEMKLKLALLGKNDGQNHAIA